MPMDINLLHGDCLELMKDIPDKSIDMILCDLPYGTTACKWDTIIPLEPLWEQYERIIKDNGAIVLTASQPFTSMLVTSKPKWYKHAWVWNKVSCGNPFTAKYAPLKITEDVLVFGKNTVNYYPIMVKGKMKAKGGKAKSKLFEMDTVSYKNDMYYPKNLIEFTNNNNIKKDHPTQKPVPLFEYLIKTYTNEGETVLDNCMGSGSTGVACVNTNRNFIGIELDDKYFEIAKRRISEARNKPEQITMG
jgi:site-specific DNA-methyltransferase (adenine-specific)